MKKLLVVGLCLSMILGLCACGSKDVNNDKNKDKENTKIETSVETEDDTENVTEEKDNIQTEVEEEKEQETVKEEFVPVDITFTFDGTEFKLPSTVGAFVDAGWKPTVTSSDKLGF